MTSQPRPPGLFITGTGTEVGKTYVGAMIARALTRQGVRVGVYKPVASGCVVDARGETMAADAVQLWEAAGRPATLNDVCPQRFRAPLAPHLAAAAEGTHVDAQRLRDGLHFWLGRCDFLLVEGAGGLMSPLTVDEYNADLASDFGYPLLVVAANRLGVINDTLQTLITAATFREGLDVAGIVLNQVVGRSEDVSLATNGREISTRSVPPLLAEVKCGATDFDRAVDWRELAAVGDRDG